MFQNINSNFSPSPSSITLNPSLALPLRPITKSSPVLRSRSYFFPLHPITSTYVHCPLLNPLSVLLRLPCLTYISHWPSLRPSVIFPPPLYCLLSSFPSISSLSPSSPHCFQLITSSDIIVFISLFPPSSSILIHAPPPPPLHPLSNYAYI